MQQSYSDSSGYAILELQQTYRPYGEKNWSNTALSGKALHEWVGQEKDAESSLGDHGVRKYEYETGRFTGIDPLWEKYIGWTPYQYSGNNPIMFLDENGMFKIAAKGETYYSHTAVDIHSEAPTFANDVLNNIFSYAEKSGILDNILKYTNLTRERVERDFTENQGTEIFVVPIQQDGYNLVAYDKKILVNSRKMISSEMKTAEFIGMGDEAETKRINLNYRTYNMNVVIWEYLRDAVDPADNILHKIFNNQVPGINKDNTNYINALDQVIQESETH